MEVSSNWMVDSVLALNEAIQETCTLPSEDVAELLDEDKCFSLTKPDDGAAGEACTIRLSCTHAPGADGGKTIQAIVLHSEARVVEVCVGTHDEYLKTVHGKRLGQYEDTEMCACLVEFSPPRLEVLLTLKHTYNLECVWVFGLLAVTGHDKIGCGEGRFSSANLSSVLKDKQVNISKDAARFLHLLESYNACNHGNASVNVNQNNQLALMSMFVGQKMLGAEAEQLNQEKIEMIGVLRTLNADSEENISAKKSELSLKRNGVEDSIESDIESRMKRLGIVDEENNETKAKGDVLASVMEKTDYNFGSKEAVTTTTKTVPSTLYQNTMMERLFELIGNTKQGFNGESQNASGQQQDLTKQAPHPILPRFPLQSALPQDHISPRLNTMNSVMETFSKMHSPQYNSSSLVSPSSAISGPKHSTPKPKLGEHNNNVLPEDSCDSAWDSEGKQFLLRDIENIIDRKFAEMEERLINRMERKLTEKAQIDKERLDKIEESLSKLCQHFFR